MCSQTDHPPYEPAATRPTCGRLVWTRGMDRPCGQSVALVSWTDTTGRLHHGCPNHVEGMKRRYPASLPERSAEPHGRLRLSTPWARGAFGPGDVIDIENTIPDGWEVGVSVSGNRSWVIVWVVDPEGREVTRWREGRNAMQTVREAVAWITTSVPA